MQLHAVKRVGMPEFSTPRTSAHPIDLVHLSRYTLGDRALEQEALELFCTQAVVYLERLTKAASDKEWHDAAHSLKGSARAVGAWRVAAAAEAAEALQGDDLERSREGCALRLHSCIREAKDYVHALLAER